MSVMHEFYTAPAAQTTWLQRVRAKRAFRQPGNAIIVDRNVHESWRAAHTAASDAFINVNNAVERAVNQIAQIEEHVTLGTRVKQRLLTALRATLDNESVFPSITTDGDDGLIAQWKAGATYLALEILADGDYSLVHVDDTGALVRNEAGAGQPDFDVLKALIRDFTALVNTRNPQWRDLFA